MFTDPTGTVIDSDDERVWELIDSLRQDENLAPMIDAMEADSRTFKISIADQLDPYLKAAGGAVTDLYSDGSTETRINPDFAAEPQARRWASR